MPTDRFSRLILKVNKLTEVDILPVDDGYNYYWEYRGTKSENFDTEELALIDWMQKVCEPQPLGTQKPSDRELLDQLQILVDTASSNAEKERELYSTYEEYDKHRFWCFKKINESFRRIANQITTKVYYDNEDPLTTYEEDMRAFLKAHTDRLKEKALEKMELHLGSPENWGK